MKQIEILRRFWPYASQYKGQLTLSSVIMILMVLMNIVAPLPLKVLFDNVIGNKPLPSILVPIYWAIGDNKFNLLILMSSLVVAIGALSAFFRYKGESRVTSVGQKVVFRMRNDLYAHMQRLSLSFFERRRTGDMIARLTSDMQLVQQLIISGLFTLLTNTLTLLGMTIIMFLIDWRLALLALVIMPVMSYTVYHYTSQIGKLSKDQRRREGQLASISQETISSMKIVQAYNGQDREIARFNDTSEKSLESSIISSRLQAAFTALVIGFVAAGTSAIIFLGGFGVLTNNLTAGDIIVFFSYVGAMYSPMRNLSKLANTITKATAAAERIIEVLDAKPEMIESPGALDLTRVHGLIQFEHVDFGYDPVHLVLRDISIEAMPGEKIAIVGPTGSGKTTILSLLLRFYEPDTGTILIDGLDLKDIRLASIRQQIAIVLQEAVLFQMTVRENIAYGRPEAKLEEIINAAKAAQAHDFISHLPNGYETIVGERGSTLSGGERQRIAIARAILKNSPVVVLDEPTTGLDAESESLVMMALNELTRNRTTIIITHRLSTIRDADRIYMLENGRIIERGTHSDLIEQKGRYSELYLAQTINPADKEIGRDMPSDEVMSSARNGVRIFEKPSNKKEITELQNKIRTLEAQNVGLSKLLGERIQEIKALWNEQQRIPDRQVSSYPEKNARQVSNLWFLRALGLITGVIISSLMLTYSFIFLNTFLALGNTTSYFPWAWGILYTSQSSVLGIFYGGIVTASILLIGFTLASWYCIRMSKLSIPFFRNHSVKLRRAS